MEMRNVKKVSGIQVMGTVSSFDDADVCLLKMLDSLMRKGKSEKVGGDGQFIQDKRSMKIVTGMLFKALIFQCLWE
jgi:hypothetical protein